MGARVAILRGSKPKGDKRLNYESYPLTLGTVIKVHNAIIQTVVHLLFRPGKPAAAAAAAAATAALPLKALGLRPWGICGMGKEDGGSGTVGLGPGNMCG